MDVSFVVAMARNRVIGRDGALPWRLPRDLRHFRALTWGKPIIMGRKTHESLGRALPGRLNIVLSRGSFPHTAEIQVAHSVEQALEQARLAGAEEAMIIGGGQVYEAFHALATRIHLTLVEGDFPGDTYFPFDPLAAPDWRAVHDERWEADASNPFDASYLVLERGSGPAGSADA
ncbi:dihydrofolate reductase [Planctomyces sp. SH-PL62]|uniref:dihydrofolate reductase n=1 Tax=Planctomyces sp. SH-PL62 TaxID=1636152 RepID=UPI00078B7336|nr:dihydrofolate reductase [Planctomyces sp. SH-PL62]AMV38597.1 Dihydrofolate reductase type 3 [Planctomyces sp. SH-PL62]